MKNKLVTIWLIVIMCFLTSCAEIKSEDEYYSIDSIESDIKIMISIDCSDILDNMDILESGLEKYIPDYGLILEDTEYSINSEDTVYDALVRAIKDKKIRMEVKSAFGTKEVEGLNYIYNSSCGEGSRWIYKINGEIQQPVCSNYKLKDGDNIQWIYVCNAN